MLITAGKHVDQSVDHDVTDQMYAVLGNAFPRKILVSIFRWSKQQVRELIGNQTIDLFRHAAIEGPKPCFYMSDANAKFGTNQGRGNRGVNVTINKDQVRSMFEYDGFELKYDLSGLLCMTS